jgi:carbamoyl-phosphate synthase large subunit
MEHIEFAGVHSGDSACVIPPVSIPDKHKKTIEDYSRKIAAELGVKGLMNIQYAIENDKVYVLEANPRASRTVPLVSKVCGIQMADAATRIMMGAKLKDLGLKRKKFSHFGVKESVFPFNMYPEVDPILGPEMRSTGEVLGMADSFPMAYFKAEEAAKPTLPTEGTVLISTQEKTGLLEQMGKEFGKLGFKILATEGTQKFLSSKGIECELILKLHEGRPNINDAIANKRINLVVNTPVGKKGYSDASYIRKASIKHKVPYITTLPAALAAAKGIAAYRKGKAGVMSLQDYHGKFEE